MIAAAVATPLAAASPAGGFVFTIATPVVQPGAASTVLVGIPAEARPIVPGRVTLTYRRTTGAGSISGSNFPRNWDYGVPGSALLTFTALRTAPTETVFTVNFSGESTWAVELLTPKGFFSGQIEVTA